MLAATNDDATPPQRAAALETLCRVYWYPLYVYVRRRGRTPEDAQDLTQQFFAALLERDALQCADPHRGRFRTFLLHALENFLINQWRHTARLKRGGGAPVVSLDAEFAEQQFAREASTSMTPERAYEKRWALALLDQVLASLRNEYLTTGKEQLFEELARLLWGKDSPAGPISYAELGDRLGMKEGAVRVAMHSLRARYRELLTSAVAQTVSDPGEVEEELRYLLLVLSRKD